MEGYDGKGKRQRPEDDAEGSTGPDNEDEKVEMFFALLKSIRQMRERRRRTGGSVTRQGTRVEGTAWIPTFQWEDFAGAAAESVDIPAVRLPATPRKGGSPGKGEKEEEGTGQLDLRLSL